MSMTAVVRALLGVWVMSMAAVVVRVLVGVWMMWQSHGAPFGDEGAVQALVSRCDQPLAAPAGRHQGVTLSLGDVFMGCGRR
jgi:hypothetical protein